MRSAVKYQIISRKCVPAFIRSMLGCLFYLSGNYFKFHSSYGLHSVSTSGIPRGAKSDTLVAACMDVCEIISFCSSSNKNYTYNYSNSYKTE